MFNSIKSQLGMNTCVYSVGVAARLGILLRVNWHNLKIIFI
jgi:hypothetical protein